MKKINKILITVIPFVAILSIVGIFFISIFIFPKEKIIIPEQFKRYTALRDTLHHRYFMDYNQTRLLAPIIIETADIFGINQWVIVAMIKVESDFDYFALNKKNKDYGLMQINVKTGEEIADKLDMPFFKEMLYDPYFNILFGCFYFDELRSICRAQPFFADSFKNIIIAYNYGIGNYYEFRKGKKKLPDDYQHWQKIEKEFKKLTN